MVNKPPRPINPHIELGFDYSPDRVSGNNTYADCIFCGRKNKLYINIENGMYDCKSCGEKGNTPVFLASFYDMLAVDIDAAEYRKSWKSLSDSRLLPVNTLKKSDIVFDGDTFYVAARNLLGKIVNLYRYRVVPPGSKTKARLFGLTGVNASIYGLEQLAEKGRSRETVYLCEGLWDVIALRSLLEDEGKTGIVLGIPGASVFKREWVDYFDNRHVVMSFDNDTAGDQGLSRVYSHIKDNAKKVEYVAWPMDTAVGYDVRDFVTTDGDFETYSDMIQVFVPIDVKQKAKEAEVDIIPIDSPDRPSFDEVLKEYSNAIYMSKDMEDALKVIYATILTTPIPQNPLWIHIVGPPGSGKTLMLMSTSDCVSVYPLSKITPKTLISGFIAKNGEDPSLIPRLNNKCLIIKDFTATTSMPKMIKDELYGIFRDAYDGEAGQEYANNVKRKYKSHFNVLTGVTASIQGERSAALGERFLMLHFMKGAGDVDSNEQAIRASIRGVGRQSEVRQELLDIASKFLNVEFDPENLPPISTVFENRVVAISQIVAVLRAAVERDTFNRSDHRALKWRPQPELATRLAAQLTKLLIGLALLRNPQKVEFDDWRVVCRVAIDSCVGFNMDAVAELMKQPWQTRQELAIKCRLSPTTLKDHLDDLLELGAIQTKEGIEVESRMGMPGIKPLLYAVADRLSKLWIDAGLSGSADHVKAVVQERKRFGVRVIRRKR